MAFAEVLRVVRGLIEAMAPPLSLIRKRIGYHADDWPRLIRFLNDGRIGVYKVLRQNFIRPFVVGIKAWLFSNTPAVAHSVIDHFASRVHLDTERSACR